MYLTEHTMRKSERNETTHVTASHEQRRTLPSMYDTSGLIKGQDGGQNPPCFVQKCIQRFI